MMLRHFILYFFFFTATATTEIYTLSLHDALPISNKDHDAFVAVHNDEVIGWIGLTYSFSLESPPHCEIRGLVVRDRKSTRLNSSHTVISYAVFCLKKKKYKIIIKNRRGYN